MHQRGMLAAAVWGLLLCFVRGISVDVSDDTSVKNAASEVAKGLMGYYTNGASGPATVGSLPNGYFFWQTGVFFETFIEYWSFTGDSQYNDLVSQGVLSQVGSDDNFMPANFSATEGNDDQGTWAHMAMTAAEVGFPNPPSNAPQWITLVQNVLVDFIERWDTTTCRGGLRWQIAPFNNGYDFKNSISNGFFFNVAARLALVSGNQTYASWANKVFAWEQEVGFITNEFQIFDGASTTTNCSDIDKIEWSLTSAVHLGGAAAMYNMTQSSSWKNVVDGLVTNIKSTFTQDNIIFESACEPKKTCDTDMTTYKSVLIRSLAYTAFKAPFTADTIDPILKSTATAAANSCSGSPSSGFEGAKGTACGFSWDGKSSFDGMTGAPEEMNALSALMVMLPEKAATNTTSSGSGSPTGSTSSSSTSSSPTSAQTTASQKGNDGQRTTATALVVYIAGCIAISLVL